MNTRFNSPLQSGLSRKTSHVAILLAFALPAPAVYGADAQQGPAPSVLIQGQVHQDTPDTGAGRPQSKPIGLMRVAPNNAGGQQLVARPRPLPKPDSPDGPPTNAQAENETSTAMKAHQVKRH